MRLFLLLLLGWFVTESVMAQEAPPRIDAAYINALRIDLRNAEESLFLSRELETWEDPFTKESISGVAVVFRRSGKQYRVSIDLGLRGVDVTGDGFFYSDRDDNGDIDFVHDISVFGRAGIIFNDQQGSIDPIGHDKEAVFQKEFEDILRSLRSLVSGI